MKKLLVFLPIMILAACQPVAIAEEPSPASAPPTQFQPVESDFTPVPEPEMNPLVELAIQDLATRLNLAPELVTVIEVQPVTWPDASLGCPQEGMLYAQMEIKGFFIRLEIQGQIYEYHTDNQVTINRCEYSLKENNLENHEDKNVVDGWPSQPKDGAIIKLTPTKRP